MFWVKVAYAKVLPQSIKKDVKINSIKTAPSANILISPHLRSDHRALNIYFANLQNASAVSYLLTYKTSVQDEGAIGTLNLNLPSISVELLFGTCSKNICRYHTGVHDAKLEITYTTKSGKKYIKRYRIKV